MSNSLVLTFASIHSGALLSLICQIPSLKYENDVRKSVVVILSVSSLSVDSNLSIVLIDFTIYGWSVFHWKLFPCVCSFSSWSLVDCGIIFDRMLLQNDFSQLWFCVKVWWTTGCMNVFICFVASTSLSSSYINLKSLMKFSLRSCHMNVFPRDSSILYHLLGKSSNVDGNRCGHMHSSL